MRFKALAILVFSSVFFAITSFAVSAIPVTNNVCDAAEATVGNSGTPTACEKKGLQAESTLFGSDGIVVRIVRTVLFVVGAVSVVMVMVGGLRYILSAGDSNGISGAKNTILYALVGLVVAIFAQAIVTFVINRF